MLGLGQAGPPPGDGVTARPPIRLQGLWVHAAAMLHAWEAEDNLQESVAPFTSGCTGVSHPTVLSFKMGQGYELGPWQSSVLAGPGGAQPGMILSPNWGEAHLLRATVPGGT